MWWKGRVKELEGSYLQASNLYEQVYEKQPTIDRLNRLARYFREKPEEMFYILRYP